ncbi:hypothetical protein K6959_14085 [Bacillus aquiflavi]|uniref:hypothetical protein n=1 Tax=Bacillus aquiflavi TaxID=2672567 RepID=UPI001CA7D2C1|nr:hypothetical protein [Bacillus aquiflavi]UAC47737.1 hypothetical protein K6959_14085 [Bacillus aquiflavi]
MLVIIFILLGKYNRLEVHEILKQYKALEQKYPNRFNNFKEMIPILLKTALSHLLAGKPATNLFFKIHKIIIEKNQLNMNGIQLNR